MKINFCIIAIALLILSHKNTFAQTIPNAGFENWSKTFTPAEPQSWISTNSLSSTALGVTNVTKSTDHKTGNYSVKIENVAKGTTSIPGGISYSTFAQIFNQAGGVPYTSKPDSISFSYKCNLTSGDTGHLVFLFKNSTIAKALSNNGAIAGIDFKLFGNKNTWHDTIVHIKFPFDTIFPYSYVKPKPDTLFVAALATNLFSSKINAGNVIMLDNIRMKGNSAAQIPNNDFENWDSSTIENPDGWYGANDLAIASGARPPLMKTVDKASGTYAMQVRTEAISAFGNADTLGFATTGHFGPGGIIGGFPVNAWPGNFGFSYKYSPAKTGDSAAVAIIFKKNGKNMDSVVSSLPPQSSYTQFALKISAKKSYIPDSVNIIFSAGNIKFNNTSPHQPNDTGSILIVDDLAFNVTVGIEEELPMNIGECRIFPNPTSGNVYFQFHIIKNCKPTITIYNTLGTEMYKNTFTISANSREPLTINTGQLNDGIYFYKITDAENSKSGTLIIKR